jgi:hypothetical protein
VQPSHRNRAAANTIQTIPALRAIFCILEK